MCDSNGYYGGGYYDKQTQEAISEEKLKSDSLYMGDKSQNSIYDPFYLLTAKEYNTLMQKDSDDLTDVEERGLLLRARIVPNSFFCANYDKEYYSDIINNKKAIRQEQVFACVVELFNPFPMSTGSRGKITITSLSYKIAESGKELSDLGLYVNGNVNVKYLSQTPSASYPEFMVVERINDSVFKFFQKFPDPQLSAYVNLPTSIPPQTSIYLPVFLSYLPDESGNISRSVMPLAMSTGIDFNALTYPIRSFEMTLRIGVRQGTADARLHVCRIDSTAKENSHTYHDDKSESVSVQSLEYFRPWATPIYSRPEFWSSLFLQKKLDLRDSGGRASRSYWWSYNYLHEVAKFANPFGAIDLSNI